MSGMVVLAVRMSRSGTQAPTCTCPKSLPPVVPGSGAHQAWGLDEHPRCGTAAGRGGGAVPDDGDEADQAGQARQCEPDARFHAVLPRVTRVQGRDIGSREASHDPGLDHNTVEDRKRT